MKAAFDDLGLEWLQGDVAHGSDGVTLGVGGEDLPFLGVIGQVQGLHARNSQNVVFHVL